jgi:short-subunit dehydrogenase
MPYALITGASKGIGKSIAFELAKHNFNILLTARSAELLQQTAKEISEAYPVKINFLPLDLSEINAPEKLYNWCKENNFDVGVLINNAGFGLSGVLQNFPLEKNTDLIQLNIVVPTQLCQLFIPLLQQQEKSFIMNIASTAAYQSVPYLNVYAASKAYIKSFSRGLSHELSGANISVTCISPGPTDTDWATTAGVSKKVLKMADKLNMTPSQVAKIAVNAMLDKRKEIVPGVVNKLGVFMAWLLPQTIVEKSVINLYK